MIDTITNFTENEDRTKTRSPEARIVAAVPHYCWVEPHEQQAGFTKVFRWPVPAEQTPAPTTVEVIGSFSGWRKVPLSYDPPSKTWQLILHNIEGNRTHRYVLLVDGKPTYDKTCDGLATPHAPEEAEWQITTPKGARVMLLFGQTK